MKKTFIVLILLATLIFAVAGQDKIEWNENKRLTINDFKGTPPDPLAHQSLIAKMGVDTNLDDPEIKTLKTFNWQVTNYFYPNDSWILWTDKSRLRYSLTLFDMDEWMARELRKRLNDNREQVLLTGHEKILNEVRSEFVIIREQYNGETEYGSNPIGQMKWESKIMERLSSLSGYCKTCE